MVTPPRAAWTVALGIHPKATNAFSFTVYLGSIMAKKAPIHLQVRPMKITAIPGPRVVGSMSLNWTAAPTVPKSKG